MLHNLGGRRLHLFCDLDGTIADTSSAVSEFLWREHELDIAPDEQACYTFADTIEQELSCADDQRRYVAEAMATDIRERLFTCPDAYLAMLPVWHVMRLVRELCNRPNNDELRWFVTARPTGTIPVSEPAESTVVRSCERATLQWLARWGLWPRLEIPASDLLGCTWLQEGTAQLVGSRPWSLRFIKRRQETKAHVLDSMLTRLLNRRRLPEIAQRDDVVVILEDKPSAVLSLLAEAADTLSVNKVNQNVRQKGIQVVVLCVNQAWNNSGSSWDMAGAAVFNEGVNRVLRVSSFGPQVTLQRCGPTIATALDIMLRERRAHVY